MENTESSLVSCLQRMPHMSKTKYILDDFAEKLADIAVVDKPSKVEGRSIVMFLTAKR